ncbi:RnfABCDGE type electron transport complex subunit B [Christensenellaceae bacterium OttesenSCG-928-M15]|nr:RnfABCDGE type electron transport complex subunit B [Christensenellaceae bacterium OttesenSCG-928-M15]
MAIVYAFGVMAVLGLVFGAILTVADKKFQVEVDERIVNVRAALPSANCGGCGFVGCDSFAEAVVAGKAEPNGCTAGGAATAVAIGKALGIKVEAKEPKKAKVLCQGTSGVANKRYEYDGYRSCSVAASMAGGPKDCRFACIGLGDCAFNCRFGAIKMDDGVAKIDEDICVGCGTCVEVCPRSVIELMPVNADVIVRCRNSDVAREARAVCMKACIGCKRCEKECKYDAIHVENGFARIDQEKCTHCGDCVKVCPCKCITDADVNAEEQKTQGEAS